MTAAVSVSRPVLYLVPGSRVTRPRPATGAPPGPLRGVVAELAAQVLGTVFVPAASSVATELSRRAPLLVRRGRVEVWAAAIVFLLAEQGEVFTYDPRTTRTSFARELSTSLPTLRRRGADIRAALAPLHLDLPEPEIR